MQLGSVLLTDQRWKTNTVSERYTKWNTHQPFAAIPENRSDFCFFTVKAQRAQSAASPLKSFFSESAPSSSLLWSWLLPDGSRLTPA